MDHLCDPGWLLQYRSLSKEELRQAIIHVESKIPSILMKTMKVGKKNGYWIISISEGLDRLDFIRMERESLNRIANLPKLPPLERIPLLLPLFRLQDEEKRLTQHFIPLDVGKYRWAQEVIRRRAMQIIDSDVLEFLAIAKMNPVKFRIANHDGSMRYFQLSIS